MLLCITKPGFLLKVSQSLKPTSFFGTTQAAVQGEHVAKCIKTIQTNQNYKSHVHIYVLIHLLLDHPNTFQPLVQSFHCSTASTESWVGDDRVNYVAVISFSQHGSRPWGASAWPLLHTFATVGIPLIHMTRWTLMETHRIPWPENWTMMGEKETFSIWL